MVRDETREIDSDLSNKSLEYLAKQFTFILEEFWISV